MGLLDGQRAVVTGGGSGIGRATCRRMAAEGASVAVLDVDGDAAATVAAEIDGHAFTVDVTDYDAVAGAVRRCGGTARRPHDALQQRRCEQHVDDPWTGIPPSGRGSSRSTSPGSSTA